MPTWVRINLTSYPDDPTAPLADTKGISFDRSASHFVHAGNDLDALTQKVRLSREFGEDVRAQLIGELTAGLALLRAPNTDSGAVRAFLLAPLDYLQERASAADVCRAAQRLSDWLRKSLVDARSS